MLDHAPGFLRGETLSLSTDDLDAAVQAAAAARLENTGQSCNAAKRFIVADDLYEPFVEKFTAVLTGSKVGDPFADDTVLGPLSSEVAAKRLADQVDTAIALGATLVAGGARDGAFYPATVLTDVTPEMDAHRQEFFGPVAVVYRAADEDEAVRIANDTPFGLGSFVFTTDEAQAERVADRIEAGHGVRQPGGRGFSRAAVRRGQAQRHRARDGPAGRRRVRQQEARPRRAVVRTGLLFTN
jgi:succinate-semialdehyde dehydrogenase/glutarate-semialdehyde dehydrogenase